MTDWTAIVSADFAIPLDVPQTDLIDELIDALGSPDPVLRDEQAYPVLGTWILAGHLDDRLAPIGTRVVELFDHPQIQARTFAALILAVLVQHDAKTGVLDAPTVLAWRDRFARWWLAETDLRGFDDRLGWLHAVAHGADVIGELGQSPRLDGGGLAGLLDLVSSRLLTSTSYVFAHQEDDRVALAVATVLTRPELSAAAATGWLDPVRRTLEARELGHPVPAPVANAVRTLRSLYLMADRGIRLDPDSADTLLPVHRTEILAAVGDLLHLAFPHQI